MRRFGKRLGLPAAVALLLGLAACGKNDNTARGVGEEGAQPAKPSTTAETGASAATGPIPAPPAPQPGAGKSRRIVFVFKSAGQYSEACKRGAEQADAELKPKGVTVEYMAPDKDDVGKQITILTQLIADKADAVVISPNDAKAIVPIIKQATDAGVKVFTWDSNAPASQRIFYVAAADDVKIGEDIADALAKDLGGKGKVQIMSGGRAAANLNLHVQGMEQGFKKYPGITLVQPYIYNEEDVQKAVDLSKAAFQKDPDIAGFACANSQGPPGAGEAVTQLGKIGKVKVWGLSLPSQTKSYLKSGAIAGVMLWDPAKLTYLTAELVNDYLDGQVPKDGTTVHGVPIKVQDRAVIMPGVTFTKENVDQYNF